MTRMRSGASGLIRRASGNAVTNWLPPAGLSSIHRRPSIAATRRRAANRPTPVPGASVRVRRTNGSKTLSRMSGGTPGPSSPTATRTSPSADQSATTISAPGGAYFAAFSSSSSSTCASASGIAERHAAAGGVALEPMSAQQRRQAGQHLVDHGADVEAAGSRQSAADRRAPSPGWCRPGRSAGAPGRWRPRARPATSSACSPSAVSASRSR